jgi:hypothetical protein
MSDSVLLFATLASSDADDAASHLKQHVFERFQEFSAWQNVWKAR